MKIFPTVVLVFLGLSAQSQILIWPDFMQSAVSEKPSCVLGDSLDDKSERFCFLPATQKSFVHFFKGFMGSSEQAFIDSMAHVAIYLSQLDAKKNGSHLRTGWWQLTLPVAYKYGLRVTESIDERKDPVLSTKAAALYFKDLMDTYWDAELATLAFIEDPAKVNKEQNGTLPSTALSQRQRNLLRIFRKTKAVYDRTESDYIINKTLPMVFFYEKMQLPINTEVLAKALADPHIMTRNPSLSGKFIDDGKRFKMRIWINKNHTYRFREARDSITKNTVEEIEMRKEELLAKRENVLNGVPDPKKFAHQKYKVQYGDNLGLIAQKFSVSITDLKNWNNLRSDLIRAGQTLVVYAPKTSAKAKTETQKGPTPKTPARQPKTTTEYLVQPGDTLWQIARKYPGISADDIMQVNSTSAQIYPGQVLKIPVFE